MAGVYLGLLCPCALSRRGGVGPRREGCQELFLYQYLTPAHLRKTLTTYVVHCNSCCLLHDCGCRASHGKPEGRVKKNHVHYCHVDFYLRLGLKRQFYRTSALHSLFLRYSICGAVQSEPGPQLDSTEAVPSPQLN